MAIEKRGDRFVVTDRSGKRVLGRHDTKKKAMDQLKAIEAQKSRKDGAKRRAPNG